MGNRLTEQTIGGTSNTYVYDAANRLTSVDGIAYTWDNNGNLLSDGTNTYSYNHANRLTGVYGPMITANYGYNGLGDRLQQTMNGVTTTYALDLAGGLTQVLADGTHTYLYGSGRIGQYMGTTPEYFLGDALGSVRQLADASGNVTLAKSYEPYGEVLGSAGNSPTAYGFTGEWTDHTGLVYLRARYYEPMVGRLVSHDTWGGDANQPISYNAWLYVDSNPINIIDPTGNIPFLPPPCITGSARQCVDFATWQYSKDGPILLAGALLGGRFDCNNRDWTKPVNASELLTDYICERGPDQVPFNGSDVLTKEMAFARVMDYLRKRFYEEGNIPKPGESPEFKFNPPEYLISMLDIPITGEALPIVQFLGSFDYQVTFSKDVQMNPKRVMFKIYNETNMASGTHIPLRFPPESERENPLSLEKVINNNRLLDYLPASVLIAFYRDAEGNPIVSILEPWRRNETGGRGGGAMVQTFEWTERYLVCGLEKLPWPRILSFIDIR